MTTNKKRPERICRFGLMSRLDYPSGGYRQALLERAAADFLKEDVDFIVLAGGLVAGKTVVEKLKKLKKAVTALNRQIKSLNATLKKQADDEAAVETLTARVATLTAELESVEKQMTDLGEEPMAESLSQSLPFFVNAQGEPVKIYIIPSPAYDGAIGEAVAQLLATKRPTDIRVYNSGSDRLTIKGSNKTIEVLVPTRGAWMRGDYMSTAVERVLKDKRKQSSRRPADLQVVGCFGVTITKPRGELPQPYVTSPILHRMSEVKVVENQIGVRVVDVFRSRVDPVVRTYNYKDLVSRERAFVGKPSKNLSKLGARIIAEIKKNGQMPAGVIADKVGASREDVLNELQSLVRGPNDSVSKVWPGLVYHEGSKRWDLDSKWMKRHLRYPVSAAAHWIDSIVAYGCTHFGSVRTDYKGFMECIPRVVLERNASVLVGAGDLISGIKHNLPLRGEIVGGMNNTQQEIMAGKILAKVNMDVFKVRFNEAIKSLESKMIAGKVTREDLLKVVDKALLTNVIIPGNHDLWCVDNGHTPLVTMFQLMNREIADAIEEMLAQRHLHLSGLNDIVEKKIILPNENRLVLPSGLQMSILHPHMSRAQTTSLRPQGMLDKESGSHIVIGANFHVGEHLEMWDGELGQRVCVELGTLQQGTDFEDNKLKTVDQGFAALRVESVNNRIVQTECAFYSTTEGGQKPCFSRDQVFQGILEQLGL